MPESAEPDDRSSRPGFGNDPRYASLRETFTQAYGGDDADDNAWNDATINVIQAPGRVNLIGEHVDYNDGLVFPMAIQPRVTFAVRRRRDGQIRVQTEQYPHDEVTFEIDDEAPGEPAWSNYVRGPIAIMRKRGMILTGMDMYLMNSLSSGAGLSSSAALEVGTTVAMLHLSGGEMTCKEIAVLCREAENTIVGVPVGIMDMTAVACAREDHAMLIDCRTHEITQVPLDPEDLSVVVCDTHAKHALVTGEYAQRQQQCQAAARYFGEKALRDVTEEQLRAAEGKLDDLPFRRARHVVSEIARVRQFADALSAKDYTKAGELMYASHASLRDDYEVSTRELDFLMETARSVKGVYGSRMTGAGFGGSTVTLCRPDVVDALCKALAERFQEEFNIETHPFPTRAAAGARVVD
jgi:galactokinase